MLPPSSSATSAPWISPPAHDGRGMSSWGPAVRPMVPWKSVGVGSEQLPRDAVGGVARGNGFEVAAPAAGT